MLEPFLKRRGSDALGSTHNAVGDVQVEGKGCVLSMRGPVTKQPVINQETKDWLLWNGEIFGGKLEVTIK